MHVFSLVLATLYAAAMVLAAVASKNELGNRLLVMNIAFSCLLILGYQWSFFLWLGLFGLLLSAVCNGYRLNQGVRLNHLVIRLVLSVVIVWFYYR